MLEVVPLGGLGEFGMNMLALTWGETTIVVDAGVMFPDPELLGVDRIIPDLTYLQLGMLNNPMQFLFSSFANSLR